MYLLDGFLLARLYVWCSLRNTLVEPLYCSRS